MKLEATLRFSGDVLICTDRGQLQPDKLAIVAGQGSLVGAEVYIGDRLIGELLRPATFNVERIYGEGEPFVGGAAVGGELDVVLDLPTPS